MTQYRDELALVDHLVERLEFRLAGRDTKRLVNRLPVDECHLGVLVPWRNPEDPDAVDPDEILEEERTTSKAVVSTTSEPGPSVFPEELPARSERAPEAFSREETLRRPPSSLGCELLVSGEGEIELELEVRFAVYTQHLPTFDEQRTSQGHVGDLKFETAPARTSLGTAPKGRQSRQRGAMSLAEVFERQDITVTDLRFNLRLEERQDVTDRTFIQQALDAAVEAAMTRAPLPRFEGKGKRPAPPSLPEEVLSDATKFQMHLETLCENRPIQRPDPRLQVSLLLRTEPVQGGATRLSLYLSNDTLRGEIRTQDNINIVADVRLSGWVKGASIAPIEILPIPRDYQYDRRVWGVGHNTSVVVDQLTGGFSTHALARYDQPRLVTRDRLSASFSELAENPLPLLERIYRLMLTEINEWEAYLHTNPEQLDGEFHAACQADLERFKDEAARFAAGGAALCTDPILMQAFQGMNRVMDRIAVKKNFATWRLFQICFIVTQLPALVLRERITTGEWPAGQIHDWSDDVDVADVLWFPTGGGKTESYLGLICCAMLHDRLRGKTLGLTAWLRFPLRMLSIQQLQRSMEVIYEAQRELDTLMPDGSGDPLRLGYFVGSTTTPNSLDDRFFERFRTVEACERYRVVTDCPKCSGKGTVVLYPERAALRLIHRCTTCQYELPLVVSDSEVYRFLPALVLGTVDKMATLGSQKMFGILWTGPKWVCPTHGYGFGEYCAYGCQAMIPAPGRPPSTKHFKKISPYSAAPTLHLQDELHLLQEELGAFAGHYETLIRYCEARAGGAKAKIIAATATVEGFEHQARHLYGVKRARRFPSRGYRRGQSFYAEFQRDGDAPQTARVFVAFRPSGTSVDAASRCGRILGNEISRLFSYPEQAIANMKLPISASDFERLRVFYSMMLTYVGSLQGGTRVKDLLMGASAEILNGDGNLGVRYLSGRSTSGEIAQVIEEVEKPKDWKSSDYVHALVATSVISHGVDLERCNLMVMEKFPETAEYIQASSRSGRRKVGLVVAVLPGRNLRAGSIYNRFREYHDHLERMVSPVPVNRFARHALDRTLPGIISGLLYGMANPMRDTIKHDKLKTALERIDESIAKGTMDELLMGAQALGEGIYEGDLEHAQSQRLKDGFEHLLSLLRTQLNNQDRLADALYPHPMTSLRDVERGVPFMPADQDYKRLNWFETAAE